MDHSPKARDGFWTDHDRSFWNQHQYTTSTKNITAVQLIIGAAFGATWPLVSDILVRACDWGRYWWYLFRERQNRRSGSIANADANTPLLRERERGVASSDDGFADTVDTGDGTVPGGTSMLVPYQPRSSPSSIEGQSPVAGVLENAEDAESAKSATRGWISMIASIMLLVLSMAFAVAGSFSSTIPADSLGLSASVDCGSWSLRTDAGKEAEDSDDLLQAQKEMRAGQYGKDCYGHRPVTNPDRCTFFNSQSIPYSVQVGRECPFKDKNFCASGGYTAARFTTGLVDANVLGINSRRTPKFNRTSICVPLNIDQGFVRELAPDTEHRDYQYEYYLGQVEDSGYHSDYTYRMFGDPFQWDVPAYSISVYEATPYPERNYWTPRRELDIIYPGHKYLSIMFISSCRIVYTGPSKDYIFHADEQYPHRRDRYWNPDPRARPLTCIDWNEVCTSEGHCSPMDEEHPEYGAEYEFTRTALRRSTTFKAIQFRLGTALVAQESVGDYESLPLDDHQWIIESQAMFNTSLARIQYDALDIATGVGHEKDPGPYDLETPQWAQGKLCGIYKFQLPKGKANINVWATVGIAALVVLICVLGQETPVAFGEDKRHWFKGNWMVIDLSVWGILMVFYYIAQSVKYIINCCTR